MIIGTNSNKRWSADDVRIMAAFQLAENERCQQCGNYRYVCDNESRDIRVALHEEHCSVTAVVDKRKRANEKDPKFEQPLGTILRPSVYTASGADFSTFRDAYYDAQSAKQKEIRASRTAQAES